MQTACWQLWFPIVLRELGTRHASPPRFNPVESCAPPFGWPLGGYYTFSIPPGFIIGIMRFLLIPALLLSALTLCAADMTKLNITVKTPGGKPIERAAVMV